MLSHSAATALAATIEARLREVRRAVSLDELGVLVSRNLHSVGCAPLWAVLGDHPRVVVRANASLQYQPALHRLGSLDALLHHVAEAGDGVVGWEEVEDQAVGLGVVGAARSAVRVLGGRCWRRGRWGPVPRASEAMRARWREVAKGRDALGRELFLG